MAFSEMSKNEAVELLESRIKGEGASYSSIVNEAVRMIKEEREKVSVYEKALMEIGSSEYATEKSIIANEALKKMYEQPKE